tara:strand:- start:16 stop:825 length:810 start_codon:yes stop_codon:yes gene_type:complete
MSNTINSSLVEEEAVANQNANHKSKISKQNDYFSLGNKVVGFIFLVYLISGKLNELRQSVDKKDIEHEDVTSESTSKNTSKPSNWQKTLSNLNIYLNIISTIIITNIFIYNLKIYLNPEIELYQLLTNNFRNSLDQCLFGFNIAILIIIAPVSFLIIIILLFLILQLCYLPARMDNFILKLLLFPNVERGIELMKSWFDKSVVIFLICSIFVTSFLLFYTDGYRGTSWIIIPSLFAIISALFMLIRNIIKKCESENTEICKILLGKFIT